jgi:transcriptional regulator NrdR family protein
MTKVLKRGGKIQNFRAYKVKRSVRNAAKDAKISRAERNKLVKEVACPIIKACKRKKTVKSAEIRNLLIKGLGKKSKETAAAWLKYEKRYKKRKR